MLTAASNVMFAESLVRHHSGDRASCCAREVRKSGATNVNCAGQRVLPGGHMSCVLYVRTPSKGGHLIFGDPTTLE